MTKPSAGTAAVFNIIIFAFTVIFGLGASELLIRFKNANQQNYNIEMWRYAKLLKVKSAVETLGHEHRPNSKAKLQNVEIRINSLGMRGPEPDLQTAGKKRILFLGSSNTLGWGVPEEKTMPALLQADLKDGAVVLNAGIGNYNATRYVTLFEKSMLSLKPDIVIVHYFIRDGEKLFPGGGNFFLRHSQLAVLLYHTIQNLKQERQGGISTLVDHYRKIYNEASPDNLEMRKALNRLNELSKHNGFKVIFAMTPDIHVTNPYPFNFVHQQMKEIATSYNWTFIDFQDVLSQVPSHDLWAMPGDPHINALGQELMKNELLKHLS